MSDSKPRFLIDLSIEGFKRIKAAYLEFGEHAGITQITGANANGKSSVLDAIEALLANQRSHPLPDDAIHHGMERGRIRGHLGELIITREIKKKPDGKTTSELRIESADGALYGSPQSMLDEIYGTFTFEPHDFLRRDQKEKYLSLRRFVPDVDFELEERLHKGDFDKRTDVAREAKRLKAVAEAIAFPPDTPKVRVSEDRLTRELENAGAHNTKREQIIATMNATRARIDARIEEIKRLEARITELRNGITADEEFEYKIPDEIDTSALRLELAKARKTNDAVELRKRREEADAMFAAEDAKAAELTKRIVERTARINKAIEAATMPYDGLTLASGAVLLGGVPFEQASSAEQWRACVGIAMAENPGLRTILVRQGSLLDSKSMAIIAEMAESRGYQVIVERVDESGKVGIVLVDGQVESTPESREKGISPTELAPALEKPAKGKGKR